MPFVKKYFIYLTLILLTLSACSSNIFRKANVKDTPINVKDRVKKNIEEGRGIRFGKNSSSGGTFDFASSNELWRASLDVLDFVPFSNASYSGGILITEWFDGNSKTSNEKRDLKEKNLNQNNAVSQKHLRHFLDIENLPKSLILDILDLAESFAGVSGQPVKKVPLLRGKTIINLFFEASTRTRTTFELAAKRLSADFLNINIDFSATKKGETLLDTLRNLEAMHCDMFIVRHPSSGAAEFISKNVSQNTSVINAGDGRHAHPTQAMLDIFTIRKYFPDFTKIKI